MVELHCSKYLKEHLVIFIGNNVNACPIDQTCISLDNKQENQVSLAIFANIVKVLDQKSF